MNQQKSDYNTYTTEGTLVKSKGDVIRDLVRENTELRRKIEFHKRVIQRENRETTDFEKQLIDQFRILILATVGTTLAAILMICIIHL